MNLRHQWSGRLRGIPVAASGTLAWTLLLASPVCGQVVVQPYLGVYWFDDGALDADFQEAEFDAGPILGARVSVPIGRGWAVGGGYGLALLPLSIAVTTIEGNREVVELDAREHLYYGALEYGSLRQRPFGFLISGELGGATYSPESGGNTSDFLAGFGAGLAFRQGERLGVRFDIRDHLRFCSRGVVGERAGLCLRDDEVLHNFELSGGVTLRF